MVEKIKTESESAKMEIEPSNMITEVIGLLHPDRIKYKSMTSVSAAVPWDVNGFVYKLPKQVADILRDLPVDKFAALEQELVAVDNVGLEVTPKEGLVTYYHMERFAKVQEGSHIEKELSNIYREMVVETLIQALRTVRCDTVAEGR